MLLLECAVQFHDLSSIVALFQDFDVPLNNFQLILQCLVLEFNDSNMMLEQHYFVLLVSGGDFQIDQLIDLHLLEDALLVDAGEALFVPVAVGLDLRNEGVVEAERSILVIGVGHVIHRVVPLEDGILLACQLLCFFHASVPFFHLVEVLDCTVFEVYELAYNVSVLISHLLCRLLCLLDSCLGDLLKADGADVFQLCLVLTVKFLSQSIKFLLRGLHDVWLQ